MAKKRKKNKKDTSEIKKESFSLSAETRSSILTVVFFAIGSLLLLSFWGKAGPIGDRIHWLVWTLLGRASFLLPLCFLAGGAAILFSFRKKRHLNVYLGMALLLFSFLGLFEILAGAEKAAGWLGFVVAWPFLKYLSFWGGVLILLSLFLISLLITFDISLRKSKEKLTPLVSESRLEKKEPEEEVLSRKEEVEPEPEKEKISAQPLVFKKALSQFFSRSKKKRPCPKEKPCPTPKESKAEMLQQGYEPPPLSLLDEKVTSPSAGDIQAYKNIIRRTLAEFGIDVEMDEVNVGPSVTQYTLRPAKGVNLSRILYLRRNLSLALAAHPIRIEAPIPGKSLVGIEVPNKAASIVRLRSILEELAKNKDRTALSFGLGRNVRGQAVWADIDRMPHLLIAGATGSGKSICINNIILTLIYFNSPRRLKFVLIDPKRVELTPYNSIPHLLTPVIFEAQAAVNAMRWVISEMEKRYELLTQYGSRDIHSFNQLASSRPDLEPLPFIVIIIDELADLMVSYKREMEAVIVRLAQMARAVGIHLIASTQRPSTDVVTGLIKANITSRIAFKVASQVDSRTILDQAGAEKLLGSGDMLYMSGESAALKRIQGAFISESEVKKVTAYLKSLKGQFPEKIPLIIPEKEDFKGQDELYSQAKKIVIEAQKGSASLLQRRLRIGYARAANLLDMLEEAGVVGPARGSKPRQVLIGKGNPR